MFTVTTSTNKLLKLNKRIRAVAGGTSAGKTISILQILIDYCQTHHNKIVHVVSESYPHLDAGAMLDFQLIMQEHNYWKSDSWNDSKHRYTFETGSKLRFYSVDFSNAHGPRRDVLYINEANYTPRKVYDQLEPRTREIIWMDWNPTTEFWFYEDKMMEDENVDFITLTYKDNEALDQGTIDSIESRRDNKAWWQVYGLGQLGEVEGRIYSDWQIIDEVPHEARLERRGLDFGYSADPAAIPAIYFHNGGYILDEELYQKGMSNKAIADRISNSFNPHTMVVADSAEPKSIDELKLYGINVVGANKGPGSINQGIQYVQDQRISVTKRSVNLIREYRNYMWKFDKDGHQLDVPEAGNDHLMDAVRYAFESLRPRVTAAPVTPSWVKSRKSQWNI